MAKSGIIPAVRTFYLKGAKRAARVQEKGRKMNVKTKSGLAIIGLATITLAGCGGSAAHHSASPSPKPVSIAQRYNNWYNMTGSNIKATLTADSQRVSKAIESGDNDIIEGAGSILAADAKTALETSTMPPIDVTDWRLFLAQSEMAGDFLAGGDVESGGNSIQAAGNAVNKFSAAVKATP